MLYTKTINGRQVFSDCKTIQLEFDHPPLVAGQWCCNPPQSIIEAEGWTEYVPPVIPATPQTDPDIDTFVAAVKTMLDSSTEALSDEDALNVAALFPTWISRMGQAVEVGQRFWYDGRLWKVIQAHTVQEDWTPDTAASLFTEVSIEEWPDLVVPIPSTSPYMTGDKVTYNGQHYICQIDNCVWTPTDFPSGWLLVE